MPVPPTKLGPVVAIGSSAGGLEVMLRIFSHLRANGRTCYVVAQHMAKTEHSELVVRVLGRKSSLPVVEARDGDIVLPDRVYFIPSNWNGVLKGGRLRLDPPVSGQLSVPSVNVLFESIAEDAGSKAVGVILSGAGSDGLQGCKAIKARGGKIFVQTPESALINGMPGAVDRAGLADERLLPDALADRINDLAPPPTAPILSMPPADQAIGSLEFRALIQDTSRASRIDFSSYKEDTLLRRTRVRMKTLGLEDIRDYVLRARSDPRELENLKQLFVVSLSWLFRDRAAFDKLRELLSLRLAKKPAGAIVRVWVPGCATGEECISFAILLTELAAELRLQTKIEVIGSDLNNKALDVAQRGYYLEKSFKEFQAPDMIAKHFIREGKEYRVADHIRAICKFHAEDVIAADPPDRLDLVSCRNLLIYMKLELQEKLIDKFFRALQTDGLLFLGMSENIGLSGAAKFNSIDSSHRIYVRKSIGV